MLTSPEKPRAARFPRVPPAPDWRQDLDVLDEIADARATLGYALWEALQDTALWARAADDSRPGLFHLRQPDFRAYAVEVLTTHAPNLSDAWARLDAVSRSPTDVARGTVADACRAVYAWAEERAFMRTAAHFAEAAALLRPDAPELANLAARTCRRAALPGRSGSWYLRGRALAIRAHSFRERFSAIVGYGWLMYSFGRYDRARRITNSTLRAAVNRGFKRMAGEAEHNLLAICSEEGLYSLGERYALNALKHYPIHHPLLPFMVHDVAYLFVACALYKPALPILLDVVKTMPRPQDPVLAYATIAQAAAGAHQEDVYRQARDTALDLAARDPEHAPAALRSVAYAAQLAEDWDAAEHAARTAAELARERRMAGIERTSLVLAASIRARSPGTPEAAPPANNRVDDLVRLCLLRLKQWTGPKRGRPPGRSDPT